VAGRSCPFSSPDRPLISGDSCGPPAGCTPFGSISFSDPAINAVPSTAITSWTSNEIVFTPSFAFPSYQYPANTNVSVTITRSDGISATFPLPVSASGPAMPGAIATINGAGYGQCTWYVANTRLAQSLPIPVPPYYATKKITARVASMLFETCLVTSHFSANAWTISDCVICSPFG
jgi:hypothetical protein